MRQHGRPDGLGLPVHHFHHLRVLPRIRATSGPGAYGEGRLEGGDSVGEADLLVLAPFRGVHLSDLRELGAAGPLIRRRPLHRDRPWLRHSPDPVRRALLEVRRTVDLLRCQAPDDAALRDRHRLAGGPGLLLDLAHVPSDLALLLQPSPVRMERLLHGLPRVPPLAVER